ncbi:glycosyltransferase [Vibrio agarivorans]
MVLQVSDTSNNHISSNSSQPSQGEIWLLLDSFTFGGIETHVVELAHGLIQFEQPVRVVLLTQFDTPSAIIDKLTQAKIPYSYLYQLAQANPSRQVWALMKLCFNACQQWQPKVLHAHGYKANLISKLCSGSTRQVATFHSGETPTGAVRLYDWLDRYSACLSSHNFTVSPQIADKIPYRTQTLNNFVNTQNLKPSAGKRIAFVGRLSHEKGPDTFIEIAQALPEHHFYLYGDGDMMDELKSVTPNNVTFEGFQADMTKVWPQIGLLLITSRYEGLPMTALEAMAREIPVISFAVGAVESLIQHEHNGWIARNQDDIIHYIEQWHSIEQHCRQTLTSNAAKTITEYYSTQSVIPQLIESYQ